MATRIGTIVDDKTGDTIYPVTTVDAVAGTVKNVTVGGVSVVDDGVAEIPAASASALAIDSTPTANSQNLVTSGGVKAYVDGHSGGGGTWGSITGTLTEQTDLASALAGKQPTIDASHRLDYSLLSNTPTIPTVEALTTAEIDIIWSSN